MPLIRTFAMAVAAILLSITLVLPAHAQTVSARGTGSASFGMRLNPETRAQALEKAKTNALEAYVAETGPAKLRLFEARRTELLAQVDRYVLSSVILAENEDRKAKTYTVTIRAEINANLLQVSLDGGAAVLSASPAQKSPLTFLFMARSQDSVQSFQDREYRRADATSTYSEGTQEGESFRGNTIGTTGSITRNGSVSSTTGGSTTRRADAITWKVASAANVNTAMSGAFSAAGYDVVDAEYVEGGLFSIDRVRQEFSTGDDLSAQTLRDAAQGVNAARIPYFAYGTLDVGMPGQDPATGNVRVYVTVTGKVLDMTGRFPRTVSSVGPVQFAGLGGDASVARTNALTEAAERAAQQMINELNVKGVR
ncbi:hypothetical protein [Luteimonas sp. MC1750]|uniref:hypothetical protein n=1 Tax=Luteimonas sp. MC1750 TaxID=2799326 RepID=UPI0018F0DB3A|nr:hypothetical protein [Luteimonas sp. MC1750]MBJ6984201.1 hypothetical protein [Luteimonas sp. MC1750]QQO07011.1 hypothetical protein JGR68_06235 [Luteimonas sp. MC1750]